MLRSMTQDDFFFTYYAEAFGSVRALKVPEEHVDTFFQAIQEIASMPPEAARPILQAGMDINTKHVRFYAVRDFKDDSRGLLHPQMIQ